jgi:hypothetical protein
VAEPVKVENPSEGQRFFSTTNRSSSRRTAEFCGFAAAEAVEVRKLDLAFWSIPLGIVRASGSVNWGHVAATPVDG